MLGAINAMGFFKERLGITYDSLAAWQAHGGSLSPCLAFSSLFTGFTLLNLFLQPLTFCI